MDLSHCTLCPLACGADRTVGVGACGGGSLPRISKAMLHRWEEPPLSGTRGSGAVFFAGCNMGCLFCQNFEISAKRQGREVTPQQLAEIFLSLERQGAHNVDLVSAGHFAPQAAQALRIAKDRGLSVPVVYNTNGYETIEGLRLLEGLVDIYLPDLKYRDDKLAAAYSRTPGYFRTATAAILEMRRQAGEDRFDGDGLMRRGLIVRHLVLPGCREDAKAVLDWLRAELGTEVTVSLLRQYTPMYRAGEVKALSRRLTTFEYEDVVAHFFAIGLHNGFMQGREAATSVYTPDFSESGF